MSRFKLGPAIGIAIIAGAMGVGAYFFKGSLIRYDTFAQAVEAAQSGGTVQIMGAPRKQDTRYSMASRTLDFTLSEPKTNALMPVVFSSPKPDSFDEAVTVTAIGHYDPQKSVFEADNLLVKCPSKYAGQRSPGAQRSYNSST